jgi:hypothetical protein
MVARDDDRTPCATEKAVLRTKKPRKAQRDGTAQLKKNTEKIRAKAGQRTGT